MSLTEAQAELEQKHTIFIGQIIAGALLLGAGLVVFLTELWFPGFFPYHYFTSWDPRPDDVQKFWPLFAYGGILALIVSVLTARSTRLDQEIFGWDMLTSVLAGIWEELGYRWLFICTAMIGLIFSNWIFSTVLGIVIGGALALFGLKLLAGSKLITVVIGVFFIVFGVGIIWLCWQTDPIFWLYDHVIIPIVNFVTFGQFQEIFYGSKYPKLFVFGMIAANANFRDGHKYQGLYGMLNSWIIGFVMMWAMLNYGLMCAVWLHVLYDIEIGVVRFAVRKVKALA